MFYTNQITCGTYDSIELTMRMCMWFFFYTYNYRTFQRYKVAFKIHLDQRMIMMHLQGFVGHISERERDFLSKQHVFNVWCGLQRERMVEILLLTLSAGFLWETGPCLFEKSPSSGMMYNLPETMELIASDIPNRQKSLILLSCVATVRHSALLCFKSLSVAFPSLLFHLEKHT